MSRLSLLVYSVFRVGADSRSGVPWSKGTISMPRPSRNSTCAFNWMHEAATPLRDKACGSLPMANEWLEGHVGQLLTGKHIVFIGNSNLRYWYINLAYHLLFKHAPPYTISDKASEMFAAMNISSRPTREVNYEGYWRSWSLATSVGTPFDSSACATCLRRADQ